MTTIERKEMSKKTTFKRIALAVVAVLGLGILSSAPSSAQITEFSVTQSRAGSATTTVADTTTATVVDITGFLGNTSDSMLVSVIEEGTSRPTAVGSYSASGNVYYGILDTLGTTTRIAKGGTITTAGTEFGGYGLADSVTVASGTKFKIGTSTALRTVGVKLYVQLESTAATMYGSYNFKVVVENYSNTTSTTFEPSVRILPITITVATPASVTAAASKVVDTTKTTAYMSAGTSFVAGTVLDSAVSVISTAAASNAAVIRVVTKNANGNDTAESITATISGAGVLCDGNACGASLTLAGDGETDIGVRADGRAGVATISLKTTSVTFPDKKVTFFAKSPATVVATVEKPVIGASAATSAISLVAKDANGNTWGGVAYLVSQDTKVAGSATATACVFDSTDGTHYCDVTGVATGQSKFVARDASTAALATITTPAFDGPRVSTETIASLKIEFDKAAYAPGEKARIYVTALDKDGKTLPANTWGNAFATGGITSSTAFSSGSDATSSVSITTDAASSATTGDKAGTEMYTVYMPFGKGTVTLTAKGGVSLPVAGQVALTASASVVDDSVDAAVDAAQEATDAAIAATDAAILAQEAADEAASAAIAAQETAQAAVDAVTALSAEVTKLVAQLATLQKLLNRVAKRVGVKL